MTTVANKGGKLDNAPPSFFFIPTTELLVVNQSTPVSAVYRQLGDRKGGNFVVRFLNGKQILVKGASLASQLLRPDKHGRYVEHLYRPIGDVVANGAPLSLTIPISQYILDRWEPRFNISADPFELYELVENGKLLGWYASVEAIGDTATKRPVWICANGHRNLDPDRGFCSRCPGKLEHQEEEK